MKLHPILLPFLALVPSFAACVHLAPDPMAGPNGLTDEAVAQVQAHVVAELALDATAKASIEAVRAKEPSLQGLTSTMITALRDREILSRKVDAAVATRNP